MSDTQAAALAPRSLRVATESHAATLALVGVAGLFGAAGVALAAVGAHASGDPRLATASAFLMTHATAIVAVAAAAAALGAGRLLLAPAALLMLGVLLFSGDLTVRALLGVSPLPIAAPIGGSLLILGWLGVALGAAATAVRRRP